MRFQEQTTQAYEHKILTVKFLANGPIQCPREKQKKTDDRTIETIEEKDKSLKIQPPPKEKEQKHGGCNLTV